MLALVIWDIWKVNDNSSSKVYFVLFWACRDAPIGAFYSLNGFETEYIYYVESSIFVDKDKVYNNL